MLLVTEIVVIPAVVLLDPSAHLVLKWYYRVQPETVTLCEGSDSLLRMSNC